MGKDGDILGTPPKSGGDDGEILGSPSSPLSPGSSMKNASWRAALASTSAFSSSGTKIIKDGQKAVNNQLEQDNDIAHQQFSEELALAGVKHGKLMDMLAGEDERQRLITQGTEDLKSVDRDVPFKTVPLPSVPDINATIPEIKRQVKVEKQNFDAFDEEEKNILREKGALDMAVRNLEKKCGPEIEQKMAEVDEDAPAGSTSVATLQADFDKLKISNADEQDSLRKTILELQRENDKKREEKAARQNVLDSDYEQKRELIAKMAKDSLIIAMYKGSVDTQQASSSLLERLTNFSLNTSAHLQKGSQSLTASVNQLSAELKQLSKQASQTVSGLFSAAAMKDEQERAAQGELQRRKLEELQTQESLKRNEIICKNREGVFSKLKWDYGFRWTCQVLCTVTLACMYFDRGHCRGITAKPQLATGMFFLLALVQAFLYAVIYYWVFDEANLHKPSGFKKNVWAFIQLRSAVKLLIDFPLLILQIFFFYIYGFEHVPYEQTVFIFLSFTQMVWGLCYGDMINVEAMYEERLALSPMTAGDMKKAQIETKPVTVMAHVRSYQETGSHEWMPVDIDDEPGGRVKVVGLSKMQHLNGKDGTTVSKVTNKKSDKNEGIGFAVKMDGTNQKAKLYAKNLVKRVTASKATLDYKDGDKVAVQLHDKGLEVRAARDQCLRSFSWEEIVTCTLRRTALVDELNDEEEVEHDAWVSMSAGKLDKNGQWVACGIGDRVKITGLDNNPHMNDQEGVIVRGLVKKDVNGELVPIDAFEVELDAEENPEWGEIPQGKAPGFAVRVHGLANKPELNDMEGTTVSTILTSTGKSGYVVKTADGRQLKLFSKNLQTKEMGKPKKKIFATNLLQLRSAAEVTAQKELTLEITTQQNGRTAVYFLGSTATSGTDFTADGEDNGDSYDPMDFGTQAPIITDIIQKRKELSRSEILIINQSREWMQTASAGLMVPVGIFAAMALGNAGDCIGDYSTDWEDNEGPAGVGVGVAYLVAALFIAACMLGGEIQQSLNFRMMCMMGVCSRTTTKILQSSPIGSLFGIGCCPVTVEEYLDSVEAEELAAEEEMAEDQLPALTILESDDSAVIDKATLGNMWQNLYGGSSAGDTRLAV